jgi:plastocyanin
VRKLVVPFVVLLLLAAGCSDDDDSDAGDTSPRPTTSTVSPTSAGPATTGVALACGPTDAEVFDVVARDFEFRPTCLRYRVRLEQEFRVTNEGDVTHNVTIGSAYNQDIEPGQAFSAGKIGGGLKPGSYTLVCKIHEGRMHVDLEVLAP